MLSAAKIKIKIKWLVWWLDPVVLSVIHSKDKDKEKEKKGWWILREENLGGNGDYDDDDGGYIFSLSRWMRSHFSLHSWRATARSSSLLEGASTCNMKLLRIGWQQICKTCRHKYIHFHFYTPNDILFFLYLNTCICTLVFWFLPQRAHLPSLTPLHQLQASPRCLPPAIASTLNATPKYKQHLCQQWNTGLAMLGPNINTVNKTRLKATCFNIEMEKISGL